MITDESPEQGMVDELAEYWAYNMSLQEAIDTLRANGVSPERLRSLRALHCEVQAAIANSLSFLTPEQIHEKHRRAFPGHERHDRPLRVVHERGTDNAM